MKMLSAAISQSASGEVIAAPVAGSRLVIHGYVILALTAVTAQFKTGGTSGTAKTGAMPFGATGGAVAPATMNEDGWFKGGDAENLYLTLGSSVAVAGHVLYTIQKI